MPPHSRAPFRAARKGGLLRSEYRQRLRDGIALAWPLFAPGLRLDERTLNTVCLLTLLTALSGCATRGKAATDHLAR